MIQIKVNGEVRSVPDALCLKNLLEEMHLPADGIAVAINEAVIPRADHAMTILQDGDAVEIIHAVGGGL